MKKNAISRRDFLFGFGQRFSLGQTISNDDINIEKGDKYLAGRNYIRAKEIYLKMLKKNPNNLIAQQKLAYCYYKLGEVQKALKEFLELRKKGVKNNFLSLYLGLCFAYKGDLEKAIESLKSYSDITKPIIQRAINLQIALYESKMIRKEDLIDTIENALKDQAKDKIPSLSP